MLTPKKIIRYTSSMAIFVLIVGYGIWISRDLLFGIQFSVDGITDGMSTTNPILDFSGKTYRANKLVIDGQVVPFSDDGTWQDTLALLPGENTIQIQVTDRFKRTTVRMYHVYYKNN